MKHVMLFVLVGMLCFGSVSVSSVRGAVVRSDIENGLVAYWSFNEGTGTVAYDAIGENNATLYGANYASSVNSCTGKESDYALEFIREEHDYVLTPLNQLGEQTISLWFKVNTTQEAKGIVISTHVKNDNVGNLAIGVGNFNAGVAVVCIKHASSSSWWDPPMLSTGNDTAYEYNDEQWHHMIFTHELEGNYELFVDGVLKDTYTGSPLTDSRPYMFGKLQPNDQGEGYWFNGLLDEARIYNRTLNTSEILYLFDNPSGNQDPVADSGGVYEGYRNEQIHFNAAASYDPDEEPLTYFWEFGDGINSTDQNPTHTYDAIGNYTVSLTVTDGVGAMNMTSTVVQITKSPQQPGFELFVLLIATFLVIGWWRKKH